MKSGKRFSPHELSIPPRPSTWVCFDAPAASVHTSVERVVVTLPSMFAPSSCHAVDEETPVRSVSPR